MNHIPLMVGNASLWREPVEPPQTHYSTVISAES